MEKNTRLLIRSMAHRCGMTTQAYLGWCWSYWGLAGLSTGRGPLA